MLKRNLFWTAIFACIVMFSSCQDEDNLLIKDQPQVTTMSSSLKSPAVLSATSIATGTYGISGSLYDRAVHVWQNRVTLDWTSTSAYTFYGRKQTTTPRKYPSYLYGSDVSKYTVTTTGNCGVAAYVIARAIDLESNSNYSMFKLKHDYLNADSRRYNTEIYIETSARLKEADANYGWSSPSLLQLQYIANGTAYVTSDLAMGVITPPSSSLIGSTLQNPSNQTAYETRMINCLTAGRPFIALVSVNSANHPRYGNDGTPEVNTTNSPDVSSYLSGSYNHYIVVVKIAMGTGGSGYVYFLDPLWNSQTVWKSTYSSFIQSIASAGGGYNGINFTY
jgi:hypothetical protein